MAEPKCPSCGIEGINNIVSKDSEEESQSGTPWFNIAHCDNCGHVYGIFTKHVLSYDMTPPVQTFS